MPSVRLVRHATVLVTWGDVVVLVDPMLDPPGARPPVPETPNERRNPLRPLPGVDLDHDAVLVTHRHEDHFDDAARDRLAADVPLLCQPADAGAFREEGFTDVRPVERTTSLDGLTVRRTPARHGHGDLADRMGPVSGFLFRDRAAERSLYHAGDTVWYEGVAETLDRHDPDAVVVNAGAARFVDGDPITMDAADVRAVREALDPTVPVVAVHMDAVNHCPLTRADLRTAVEGVLVPEDGERVAV